MLLQGYPADPLLHACIVCASVSCPDVAPKAYKPETLQADMEENMRLFLQNPTKGLSLDKAAGVITLSKVCMQYAVAALCTTDHIHKCSWFTFRVVAAVAATP